MYRCIKSSKSVDHLNAVVFVLDINTTSSDDIFSTTIYESEDIYEDMPDGYLSSIPLEELHQITNIDTLKRIASIDANLLSNDQKNLIKRYGEFSNLSTKVQVQELLDMIKDCKRSEFMVTKNYLKNVMFESEYPDVDMIEVVKSLKLSDYCETRVAGDDSILGDDLFVFTKEVPYGEDEKPIDIYIKIDKNQTNHIVVALVSFHLSSGEMDHPYMFEGE